MKLLNLFTLLFFLNVSFGQQTQYQSATIGFYNCENLFDIFKSADLVNKKYNFTDPRYKVSMPEEEAKKIYNDYKKSKDTADYDMWVDYQIINEEFTPNGPKNYTKERYEIKLQNLAEIIGQIGVDTSHNAPVVMGLAEVENRKVIEDLIAEPSLQNYHYGIVHFNSYDARGIDVGLIYQKGRFVVEETKRYIVNLPPEPNGDVYKTRDILAVKGKLDGEDFMFVVNHWPSRRGGEKASEPKRAAAAMVLKQVIQEAQEENPNIKVIAMGDFNDDPVSSSIKNVLGAKRKRKEVGKNDLYSPMEDMYKRGEGTLAYRDNWNLFDLMFLSENLIDAKATKDYKLFKTQIYSNPKLVSKEGQFKGYPRRTYGGDNFDEHGYSDHFPVFSVLIRELR